MPRPGSASQVILLKTQDRSCRRAVVLLTRGLCDPLKQTQLPTSRRSAASLSSIFRHAIYYLWDELSSRPEPFSVFVGADEGLNHLCLVKVAVEGIQLVEPTLVTAVVGVRWIGGSAWSISEVFHH